VLRQRAARFAPLLCVLGCTASWGRVVEYSAQPATHSVVVEVYRTVLENVAHGWDADSLAVQSFGAAVSLDPPTTSSSIMRVPGHWADTLKHEVRVALADLVGADLADSTDLATAARSLGLVLLPADTTDWPMDPPPPRVTLSRAGFNGDSTIAALRVDMACGPLCGVGETLLLARRPGTRWRVWFSFVHVIS
jgi:hypothetical protein